MWLGKKGASKAFRHDFKWKKRNSISEAAHFFICQIHHAIRDSVYVVMKKIPYYVYHNSWRNYSRIYGVVPFFFQRNVHTVQAWFWQKCRNQFSKHTMRLEIQSRQCVTAKIEGFANLCHIDHDSAIFAPSKHFLFRTYTPWFTISSYYNNGMVDYQSTFIQ